MPGLSAPRAARGDGPVAARLGRLTLGGRQGRRQRTAWPAGRRPVGVPGESLGLSDEEPSRERLQQERDQCSRDQHAHRHHDESEAGHAAVGSRSTASPLLAADQCSPMAPLRCRPARCPSLQTLARGATGTVHSVTNGPPAAGGAGRGGRTSALHPPRPRDSGASTGPPGRRLMAAGRPRPRRRCRRRARRFRHGVDRRRTGADDAGGQHRRPSVEADATRRLRAAGRVHRRAPPPSGSARWPPR